MQLTIIKPDQVVIKDGRLISPIDMSSMPDGVRVVQWLETIGHEEMEDFSNRTLYDLAPYQTIITLFDQAANVIDNPPPPTPEEIEEQNKEEALATRSLLISKLREHDSLIQHGLPTVLTPEDIVEYENQIRLMQTVAEYPPNTEFNFPDISDDPMIPETPVTTTVNVEYDDSNNQITGTIVSHPDNIDPTTLTLKVWDAIIGGNLIDSKTFTDNGNGGYSAVLDCDISSYNVVFININDSYFRIMFMGTFDIFYIYH